MAATPRSQLGASRASFARFFKFLFGPSTVGVIADFCFCWPRSSPWRSEEQNVPKDQSSLATHCLCLQAEGEIWPCVDQARCLFSPRVPVICKDFLSLPFSPTCFSVLKSLYIIFILYKYIYIWRERRLLVIVCNFIYQNLVAFIVSFFLFCCCCCGGTSCSFPVKVWLKVFHSQNLVLAK